MIQPKYAKRRRAARLGQPGPENRDSALGNQIIGPGLGGVPEGVMPGEKVRIQLRQLSRGFVLCTE